MTILKELSPAMWIATIAYCCLVGGLVTRKHRSVHVKWMLTGIFLDFALVAALQVSRDAVTTALSFTLGFWQQAHVGCSTMAVLFYIPTLGFGFKCWKKPGSYRHAHIRFALTAFIFRTLGFFLMFSMLSQAH